MKRTLLLGTAWTASAAGAVGLGFLAVSLVGASASPGTVPLAAATSAGPSPSTAVATATPSDLQPTAQQATGAGMVYATCRTGRPEVSGAPAAGWRVDDSDDPAKVEFRSGDRSVEVRVTCVGGTPRFAVEGSRAGEDTATPAPATTDAPDDSGGRAGGGSGSDDPPGDDSAGRTTVGGHGSDDSGGRHGGGSGGGHGSDD